MTIKSLQKRMALVLKDHPPTEDGIRLLVVDTRIAMESLGESLSYPTVNMYGNWCVHPKLSHNRMYHDILNDVQLAYENCKSEEREELRVLGLKPGDPEAKQAPISGKAMNRLFERIKSCFRIKELRSELQAFYKSHGINTVLIDINHNWQQLAFLLLRSLVDRPLEVPENKEAYKIIKQQSENKDWAPVKLSLEERSPEENPQTIELWWVIEMIAPAKLTGRLFSAKMA